MLIRHCRERTRFAGLFPLSLCRWRQWHHVEHRTSASSMKWSRPFHFLFEERQSISKRLKNASSVYRGPTSFFFSLYFLRQLIRFFDWLDVNTRWINHIHGWKKRERENAMMIRQVGVRRHDDRDISNIFSSRLDAFFLLRRSLQRRKYFLSNTAVRENEKERESERKGEHVITKRPIFCLFTRHFHILHLSSTCQSSLER